MGMSVNTNIAAMNAYRNLSVTNDAMSKSLERLSSGYRINKASDDAAGLAISEGLRSQIGGMTQAVRNTQDGTSVVQTAEGALNETTSILQRMRDLSVQAANDGSLNTDAKESIQKEMGQLKSELSRIADTTTFNGTKLLDGNFNKAFQVGANAGETISVNISKAASANGLGVDGVDVTAIGSYTAGTIGTATPVAGKVYTANATDTSQATTTIVAASGQFNDVADDVATTGVDETSAFTPASFTSLSGTITFGGKSLDLASVDYSELDSTATAQDYLDTLNAAATAAGVNGAFAFGAGSASADPLDTDATALTDTDAAKRLVFTGSSSGVDGYTDATGTAKSGSAADIASATPAFAAATGASDAIKRIDAAIKTVSSVRADLGAISNRFEHTVNNLNVAIENTTASESRIRDTDMASEMTKFTRAQVLTQAGTSMLAQANQSTQSILKLLG
jgi:flagellin-like hook-associated protein FlgL